jgi:hypothetical protein
VEPRVLEVDFGGGVVTIERMEIQTMTLFNRMILILKHLGIMRFENQNRYKQYIPQESTRPFLPILMVKTDHSVTAWAATINKSPNHQLPITSRCPANHRLPA